MAEFQGDRISELKDPGYWRLCHVQTSGCMATERRTDEQRGQRQFVLDYVTDGGCDVVRLGDTRLGDDATEIFRMARGIEARTPGEALMKTLTVLNLVVCDYTAPAPVHAFAGHDTGSILYTETP